eukprot:28221-Chlamydomonas_euryale.AAC.1
MRKLRSEKASDIKVMRGSLEALRAHRDQATRLQKEADDAGSAAAALRAEIEQLSAQAQVRIG